MAKQPVQKPETIVITNFSGRLTRIVNGELNSGFAKYNTSWGYDPFSKPLNLTWLEQPTSILSSSTNLVLAAKQRYASGTQGVYAVSTGTSGNLYKITPYTRGNPSSPNADTISTVGSVQGGGFSYGASMDFFGVNSKIYVGTDDRVVSINYDGTAEATIGSPANYTNTGHALKQFIGSLAFSNGNTIGLIGTTATVTSSVIGTGQGNLYSQLNPPLGVETIVHDLDTSIDGNYLLVSASNITNEPITVLNNDTLAGAASDGYIYGWNGTDATVTTSNTIPSYAITALQTYLSGNYIFSDDSFGGALNSGQNKVLTLMNNKSPLPNGTLMNGNFVSWVCPEVSSDGTAIYGSLYYFGSLDQENPAGLYRMMRFTSTLTNGSIYQMPLNILVSNKYTTTSTAASNISPLAYGKHYISLWDQNGSTNTYRLMRFLVPPSGLGTPQLGVYETQTQLFSKRIGISQIRVYTEPTVSGNSFRLDVVGADGAVVPDGTYNYAFGDTLDPQSGATSLERINFNVNAKTQFSAGIRITNTGTANFCIKKIELDYTVEGK